MIQAYFFLATILVPLPAYAYLDPGMGNLILQSIIGGIAGGMVLLKIYWHRVKTFFNAAGSKDEDGNTNS